MNIFYQIKTVLSASANIEKYSESTETIRLLREKVETLEKSLEDQKAMILYLSSIQSDLVNECYSISDVIKNLVVAKKPKASRLVTPFSPDDDDDLIN